MVPTQRLPAVLTPLETALAALLQQIEPVAPLALSLPDALGCIAADMPPLRPHPSRAIAVTDGWALRARDLVGASSYSPLALPELPVWVEAGDALPHGCDCVVDADALDQAGPLVHAIAEAIPGQGVRRAGGEIAGAGVLIAPGRRITPLDLLLARAGGLHKLNVRRPRLRVVNIPPSAGEPVTAKLIVDCARAAGADVTDVQACGREAAAIVRALDASECDLLIIIGGSGVGRSDAAIAALARCGQVIAHGVALQPGRTSAVGRVGNVPLVALPGAPDHALAAWWMLAMPALERLSGLSARRGLTLPLLRKIASSVGITDIVLLQNTESGWMPLATGDISLDAMARADAWLTVPGASEGFAAGSAVAAYMLRE
jgi:molybdopterin biosynthesis enzyme